MIHPNLEKIESIIEIVFNDKEKLSNALIHRSYLNENKLLKLESNERYEFLGDAVLELWASNHLFHNFPQFKEGELTNLRALSVCTQTLAQTAKSIDLGQYILLSKGEEIHGGRNNTSMLADSFEAVIASIYLDQGMESVDKFLSKNLLPIMIELSKKKDYKDPKSIFQEISQAKRGITPKYSTIVETGPDHSKQFEVGVYLNDELIATGQGNSKQKAEEDASIKATKILNNPV